MEEVVQIPASGDDAELVARVSSGAGRLATILYLHGFGSSQDGEKASFFRGRAVAAGFAFISVDFQGHGLSGGSMREFSLSRCLRDVERTRRHVPALHGTVSVIGSSLGGLVALWHAARASDQKTVRSLVLIAPALGLEAMLSETLGIRGMERWRREGALEVVNEMGTFELGWGFVADLANHSSVKLAGLHTTPALIFQGKLDDRVGWRDVAAFARAVPGRTRLELLEDGDHRLIDRMDWIWSEAAKFLSGATPVASST